MTQFLVVLLIAVSVLVFLIVKMGVHPVLALFISGMLAGLGFGYGVITTISTYTSGFGSTLASIGCTIIFGSIIAQGIRDSNSVKSMVNFFIRLFRGRCLELSTALAAFIMSIPVFGDITQVLVAPIGSMIARRNRKSMSTMAGFTMLAAALTHAIVLPTPGILAVAVLLAADLGMVIVWGIVISLAAFLITWFFSRGIVAKEQIEPRPDYVEGIEPTESKDFRELLIREDNLPPVLVAAAPILVPVILIAGASFVNMSFPEGHTARTVMNALGERNIALFIGVVLTFVIGFSYKENVLENCKKFTGKSGAGIFKTMTFVWVEDALHVALLPLIITAMGGGFSAIIKSYPGIEALGNTIVGAGFPSFLVPFLIGAVMMVSVGSRTTAGMTAAAICAPMIATLGITPLATTILIGCGTMIGSHVSDSGFWVGTSLFNLNTKQGLKYITLLGSVCGVIALAITAVLVFMGLL